MRDARDASASSRRSRGTLARCEERLNEVNDKYTFELCPEYRLKMRKDDRTSDEGGDDVRRARATVQGGGETRGEGR